MSEIRPTDHGAETARIVVVGPSGAGKSSFARAISKKQNLPYIELDSLFWMPEWTPRPQQDFSELVRHAASADCWVADGNYSSVRPVLWPRATLVVWLNYSRMTVLSRVFKRTLWRAIARPKLWAGNHESFRMTFLSKESILWWAYSTYDRTRAEFSALRNGTEYRELQWIEFRRPEQAETFLRGLP